MEVARQIAGVFGKICKEDDKEPTFIEQLAFVSPEEQTAASPGDRRPRSGWRNHQAASQRAAAHD